MPSVSQVVHQAPKIRDAPVRARAHRRALRHPAVRSEKVGGVRTARFGVGGAVAHHHRDTWLTRHGGSGLDGRHSDALAAGAGRGLAGVEAGVGSVCGEVETVGVNARGADVEARGDGFDQRAEAARHEVHRPPIAVEATHELLGLRARRRRR